MIHSKEDFMLANWYIIQHMAGQVLDGLEGSLFENRRELVERIVEGIVLVAKRMEMDLENANA